MTRSILASADAVATLKIMALKIVLVVVSSALSDLARAQVPRARSKDQQGPPQ